jgi:hypothetical protein
MQDDFQKDQEAVVAIPPDVNPPVSDAHARLIALRRAALQEKKQLDADRLELHRQILALIDAPGGEWKWVIEKAHGQIDKWERNHLCHPRYVVMWRQWLSMPASFAKAAILREDDLGVSMRQNSPFNLAMNLLQMQNKETK